jgi:hypothetical protein
MEPNNEELMKAYKFEKHFKELQKKYQIENKEKINLRRREYYKEQKLKDGDFIKKRKEYMKKLYKMNNLFPQIKLIE